MKFRQFFLKLRLWTRVIRARRESKRLKRLLQLKESEFLREKAKLIKHYDKQLAVERTRSETLCVEWSNRFLQLQKLGALGVSTSLIEEKAESKLLSIDTPEELEDSLNSNQAIEFEQRREKFYADGIALNKSLSEITYHWNEIKQDVLLDVRMAIN